MNTIILAYITFSKNKEELLSNQSNSKVGLNTLLLFRKFKIYSDTLRNLVPLVQFKKHEKHPWKSVTFSKVAG